MTTVVQHRAVTPDGKLLEIVTMADNMRWMPYAEPSVSSALSFYTGEYAFETRVLPDGEWEPSAVIRQPGRSPIVITRWTL